MLTLLLTPEKTAVAGLNTEGQISLPRVSIEELPLAVGMVERIENPTGQQLWEPQDLTGWTFKVAIGRPALPPTHGTYTVTTADGTTDPIPVTGGLAALQSALNSATLAVQAEEISEGFYRLNFVNNGAAVLTTAESATFPPSDAEVKILVEGGPDTPAVHSLRLVQVAAAQTQLSDYEDEVTGTLTEVQTGGGGNNHQVRITFDPVPFGGSFYLKSVSFTESMPHDVDEDTLREAIEGMTWSLPSNVVGEGNVHVTKEGDGRYFIEFVGAMSNTDVGDIVLTTQGMRRTPVWTGSIDTDTTSIEALLGADDEVTLMLEVTGAPSGGSDRKLYREPITLVSPILRPTV